jgi:hypothetical protein
MSNIAGFISIRPQMEAGSTRSGGTAGTLSSDGKILLVK